MPMPRPIKALLLIIATGITLGLPALWVAYRYLDRTPSELLRYTEHRLYGHTRLEKVFLPVIHAIRAHEERPIEDALPNLGKGQRPRTLSAIRYDTKGLPLEALPADPVELPMTPTVTPATPEDIVRAIAEAKAGAVIEIVPGTYRIEKPVYTKNGGTPNSPIVVRAAKPGTVSIDFATMEGIVVSQPYWVFENLTLRGKCKADDYCEHAFHVVGKARATIIRNNRIEDFNAQIKINGLASDWPDEGLLQYNTLTNTRRRDTTKPVTPVDLVGASGWRVVDNLVSNFVKNDAKAVSYGMFMKGGGMEGRMERNLIICTERNISQPGTRVGLSFGGGTTGPAYCRDKRCAAEHSKGLAANNVVAHCNDFGIDVNASNQITIVHNTLINTNGIDVRNAPASANVYGNLVEGRIRARKDAWIDQAENLITSPDRYLEAPDRLGLAWRKPVQTISTAPAIDKDFCRRSRTAQSLPGALATAEGCAEENVR